MLLAQAAAPAEPWSAAVGRARTRIPVRHDRRTTGPAACRRPAWRLNNIAHRQRPQSAPGVHDAVHRSDSRSRRYGSAWPGPIGAPAGPGRPGARRSGGTPRCSNGL